jgi:hypothetical protein
MKRSSVFEPQTALVLRHLRDKGPLTQQEAAQLYQCWRLGARIKDLRYQGWNILTEMVHGGGKSWGRYWLISATPRSTKGLFPEGGEL